MSKYVVRVDDSDHCFLRTKVNANSIIDVMRFIIVSNMFDQVIRGNVKTIEIYIDKELDCD